MTEPRAVPVDLSVPLPLLKWAGGKRKIAPIIDQMLGEESPPVYLEPFLGSGAVYLYRWAAGRFKNTERIVLSDANLPLVVFHNHVKERADDLVAEIMKLPVGVEGWEVEYGKIRSRFNEHPVDLADPRPSAMFWWLNKACFNGLWRVNKEGAFNVPKGDRTVIPKPGPRAFAQVSVALGPASIRFRNAFDVLDRRYWLDVWPLLKGAHVYLDPPYWPISETAAFTDYTSDGFGGLHQLALIGAARRFADVHQARVVYSNAGVVPVHLALEQINPAEAVILEVGRSVGAGTGGASTAKEVLVRF